jgi:hypothetical protein
LYVAILFIFSGYWYIRNGIVLGNPFYPYLYNLFKSGSPLIMDDYAGVGDVKNLTSFLKMPWTITMHPQIFGGYGNQIGPAFLALLPLTLLFWRNIPFAGFLFVVSYCYLTVWFFSAPILRFAFPALPPLAILIAGALSAAADGRFFKYAINFLIVLFLTVNGIVAVFHFRHDYAVALNLESTQAYLNRFDRAQSMSLFVNANLPPDSKILIADETHLFYFDRPLVRDFHYNQDSAYASKLDSPKAVLNQLRADGFTHILFAGQRGSEGYKSLPALRVPRLIVEENPFFQSSLVSIFRSQYADRYGHVIDYNLFQILPNE